MMGAALSSPKHVRPFSHDDGPARKRRRLSTEPEFAVDDPEKERFIISPEDSLNCLALRVEVVRILHKATKRVKPAAPEKIDRAKELHFKATCRLTITETSTAVARVLHCQSQPCDIFTSPNDCGPSKLGRIELARPFYVPKDHLIINRPYDDTHNFSDSYKMHIELESAGNDVWPPVEPADLGITPAAQGTLSGSSSRQWVLTSEFEQMFGKMRSGLQLFDPYHPEQSVRQTDFCLDVDLRWTKGFTVLKRLPNGSQECITAFDPDEEYTTGQFVLVEEDEVKTNGINGVNGVNSVHGVNGVNDHANGVNGVNGANGVNGVNGMNGVVANGDVHDEFLHDLEDEVDGDQTPTRSLRTREKNKVYNLKVLSDQAQGKEKKRRSRPPPPPAADDRVTYCVPKDQPVCLDCFRCISCGELHQNLMQLQAHLHTTHSNYRYQMDDTDVGKVFRMSEFGDKTGATAQIYQFRHPKEPFNLQTYVAGDFAWLTSRLGVETDDIPRSPSRKATLVRQASDRPRSQRSQSSQAIQPRSLSNRHEPVLTPKTAQPLFDPVSKRRLEPGEPVPKHAPESEWLLHKHREFLDEYNDMTVTEAEYIKKWDNFILQQNLTCRSYFPRAWLTFVKREAAWLAAAEYRMREYSKHISVLLTRDVLEDQHLEEASKMINDARTQMEAEGQKPLRSPVMKQKWYIRKGAYGCNVCQLPVRGPRMLLCSNKSCAQRLYHRDCVEKHAATPVTETHWLCNSCTEQRNEAS